MSMYAARKLKKVGKYTIGRLLGEGGFGKVFLGSNTETNTPVAIKFIDRSMVQARQLEEYVLREIETMKNMNHKHIVKLLEVIVKPGIYYLVMELAPNGELFDKIVEARKFDEVTARRYFQQLMSAVNYCHNKGVAHRDLKPENLLLGNGDVLKVCDFGLARAAFEVTDGLYNELYMTSVAGSQDYQAPEMRTQKQYLGFPCDIWSCGVILYFMLCGYLPFAEKAEGATEKRISEGNYRKDTPQFKSLSSGAKDLIDKILKVEVNERATIPDIVAHPWFATDLDMKLFDLDNPIQGSPNMSRGKSCLLGMERTNDSITSPNRNAQSPFPSPTPESPFTRDILSKAFRSCNIRRDGYLTETDLRDVMIKLNNGHEVPIGEVKALMSNFQLDDNGRLTEEAFVEAWLGPNAATLEGKLHLANLIHIFHFEIERELLDSIRRAFDAIDVDKTGVITPDNITHNTELTSQMTPQEVDHLKADIGPDGVTFERFVELLTKTSLIQNNPKLLTLAPLFEAYDFEGAGKKMKTGFTVAGLRQSIYDKLVKVGGDPNPENKFHTTFRDAEETSCFIYCDHTPIGSSHPIVKIGLQLLPSARGYTRVRTYRISGDTSKYHEWFRTLRYVLQAETEQAARDTEVKGEPELL